MSDIELITGLRTIAPHFQVLICDIWGVIHNGRNAYDGVVNCLQEFRRGHRGLVLLLSNAPRPAAPIREQLLGLGVDATCYDTIVTSGDLTRDLLQQCAATGDFPIHHVGPERDHTLFDGLSVRQTGMSDAAAIVCTGPFDDNTQGPDDYRDYWHKALERQLPFYCANPDLQVQRGDQLVWCAGALAQDYESQGGPVTYLGKPHLPVYDHVERHLKLTTGKDIPRHQWLAIGDGLKTDILGASRAGIDALLITGGVHEKLLSHADGTPDPARISATLATQNVKAIAAMRRLVW